MTEKQRMYAKLLNVHDLVYNAIETLEDIPATYEHRESLSAMLDVLDHANKQLETIMESTWWKKDDKTEGMVIALNKAGDADY